ncbi:Bacteriochlorophyllide c C-7(1)-hydroxylase [subsurface metagenome]
MVTKTVERNIITKEDIFIKARMISEGVRAQVSKEISPELHKTSIRENEVSDVKIPEKLDFDNPESIIELFAEVNKTDTSSDFRQEIIFNGSGLRAPIYLNKHSRMELVIQDNKANVFEDGDILVTGTFPKRFEWLDEKLSNGLAISTVLPSMSASIINVVFSLSCMNYNSNRGCRYCNLFSNPISKKISMLPKETLRVWAKYQGEAVKIAIDNGWRGSIAISGGALAPAQRGEYLERLEIVLSSLKDAVGDEIFRKLPKVYNHCPPENFSDMHKWKEMGITTTSFDLEVMDDAYFAAICPGKAAHKPLSYYKKAQEYSVEVFGPISGTIGCVVMGIEPMTTLIEGFDERISKGILPLPLVFHSTPGSAYEGFRPPTAEWIIEASDKMADSFMKHIFKWIKPTRANAKKGGKNLSGLPSGRVPTTHLSVLFDEISYRVNKLLRGRSINDFLQRK